MQFTVENGHHTYAFGDENNLSDKEYIAELLLVRKVCGQQIGKSIHLGLRSTKFLKAPADVVRGEVAAILSYHCNQSSLVIRRAELVDLKSSEKVDEQKVDITLIRVIEFDKEDLCIMDCGRLKRKGALTCGTCS